MIEEAYNLINLSLLDLIEYIKSSLDIIVSLKVDEELNDIKNQKGENENAAENYETLLRKLEGTLRQHIGYEHQLKIECEKFINRTEDLEKENSKLLKKIVIYFIYIYNYILLIFYIVGKTR